MSVTEWPSGWQLWCSIICSSSWRKISLNILKPLVVWLWNPKHLFNISLLNLSWVIGPVSNMSFSLLLTWPCPATRKADRLLQIFWCWHLLHSAIIRSSSKNVQANVWKSIIKVVIDGSRIWNWDVSWFAVVTLTSRWRSDRNHFSLLFRLSYLDLRLFFVDGFINVSPRLPGIDLYV